MNDNVINLINTKVIPNVDEEYKQLAFLTIVEIATALVGLLNECKDLKRSLEEDSDKIMKVINHPGPINKLRLYKAIMKQSKQSGTQEYVHAIMKAVLQAGRTATVDDVRTLVGIS